MTRPTGTREEEPGGKHATVVIDGKTKHFLSRVRKAILEVSPDQFDPESTSETGLAGLKVEGYCIGEFLGQGAAGTVVAATNDDGEEFAIKILATNPKQTVEAKTQFLREVTIGQELNHPALATTYETLEIGPAKFVVMERISGTTFVSVLQQKLEKEKFLELFEQIVEGLQAAHDLGVIHRDLKPENIMLTEDGQVKILDFGMARSVTGVSVTTTGVFKGTLKYTSPDQVKDTKRAGPPSDQFALGLIIFEALSGGDFPFEVDEKYPMKTIMARVSQEAVELHSVSPEYSADTAAVIAKMLAQEPEDRYPSVAEAFSALKASLS
jgi:serine/threonine protein kinase